MTRRLLLTALLCFALLLPGVAARAQTALPLVDQTTPFRDPTVDGDVLYRTGDELATYLVFNGTQRITEVTFKYTSTVPVNYTIRFYKPPPPIVPQTQGVTLLKTITFANLPAGTNTVTRILTPEQQFDWVAALNHSGDGAGYYSVQLTNTDGSNIAQNAGFPLATPGPGFWTNFTTGNSENVVSTGLIPFRNEFEDNGFPAVGFFLKISAVEIPAPSPVRVASLSLSVNPIVGGQSLTGTVILTGPALEDTIVPLNRNIGNGIVEIPATVTIPTGETSAAFPIATRPVGVNSSVAIQATYAGRTVQQFLSVASSAPATLSALDLSATAVRGGVSLTGFVRTVGSSAAARTITLSSNNSTVQIPATVVVPAGAEYVAFPITTSAVNSNVNVVLRATFAGQSVSQTLRVTKRR